MPTKDLTELIELTGQRMLMTETAELAQMAAHEYDEEAVVPPAGSPGERFLRAMAQGFARWIAAEGRFPDPGEVGEVASVWHRGPAAEVTGSMVAQAYVDLGLYYSAHSGSAWAATVEGFSAALDAAAGELIFTLTEEYGPRP